MGRDRMIRYTVHTVIDSAVYEHTPAEWRARRRHQLPAHGKPTSANLAKYCEAFERSTQPGGCNAHLGVTKILRARIFDQVERQSVAFYERPVAS